MYLMDRQKNKQAGRKSRLKGGVISIGIEKNKRAGRGVIRREKKSGAEATLGGVISTRKRLAANVVLMTPNVGSASSNYIENG